MVNDEVQEQSLYLSRRPTFRTQQALLQTIFRHEYVDKRMKHFDEYFGVYEKELARLSAGLFQRRTPTTFLSTHQDLAELVNIIKNTDPFTKATVLANLAQRHPTTDEKAILRSLQLCMKIWLMIELEDTSQQLHSGLVGAMSWDSGQDLRDLLERSFPKSRWNIDAKDSRLHPSFTAVFMTDVCGLKLEWTDVLTRHLWLDRRDRKLHCFTDKAFLAAHLDTIRHKADVTTVSPFPEKLLTETIWSLNLLFPHWDEPTNRFLERHGQSFHQLSPFDSPPVLNLLEFEHWRDRLAEIHDVIFLAPPVSWAQLLKDRRNPQQYWTFWIALIILFLTLLSTVATIAQAVAAFKNH